MVLGTPVRSWSISALAVDDSSGWSKEKPWMLVASRGSTSRQPATAAATAGWMRKKRPVQNARTLPCRSSEAGMM